jgi:hypothetical protein
VKAEGEPTDGGELAQTGSLVHLGIAVYHQTQDTQKGRKAIESGAGLFPLADVQKALNWFLKYPAKFVATSPGKVKLTEIEVAFEMPYTKKENIAVVGHVDLVLENPTTILVVDHKAGPSPSEYMLRQYLPQIAGYIYGVWVFLGRPEGKKAPKFKGFITRIQDLHRSSADFWYDTQLDLPGAMRILSQAACLLELHGVAGLQRCPDRYPRPHSTGSSAYPSRTVRVRDAADLPSVLR